MGDRGRASNLTGQRATSQTTQQDTQATASARDLQEIRQAFDTDQAGAADALYSQIEAVQQHARQQDTDTQRFFNLIGWADREPEVLDQAAYTNAWIAAGKPKQLYHSDAQYGSLTTEEMAKQFMGKAYDFAGNKIGQYLSGGRLGDGTYFAEQAWDSASYGTRQFKGYLNKNAKVVDKYELRQQLAAYEAKHPEFTRLLDKMTSGYSLGGTGKRSGLLSVFAAMQGYNVIKDFDYYSVLDRSALTVLNKTKKATTSMENW